ncbi:phosphatase PAP2 family protein [Burkholderia arboris]|uniref:phosphatase PAP2 family protein n=1 Tax=Burkholderia arboris TaxID=488730 RepID=UPI00210D80C8|nr:phosphatase PAP2 family protein [Burkholderia arboris]UTV56510.1 phosphatase PAP2 family protein [Burkholderia arboris]
MKKKIEGAYAIAWILTILILAIDFITMRHVGLSISPRWAPRFVKLCVVSAVVCYALFEIERVPRYKLVAQTLRCRDLSIAIVSLLTIAMYGQAAAIASYIGAAVGRPTVQDGLLAWEQAFGFDWLNTYHWVSQFQGLQLILRIAYESAFPQMIAFCFLFGLLRRRQELCEMMLIFVVSLAVVLPISTLYPAASPFVHFGIADPGTVSQVSDFYNVRNGELRVVDPFAIQGIVSLPSFHTVLALMLIYVMRNFRVLFGISLGLNVVMLVSTFSIGGHYLADIGAGAIVGIATIWWVRRWFSVYASTKWWALNS